MASPSFVYAFDNLGPDKFVELCGLLLGSRYKGFLLSSPGPDGGVDGETDPILGELLVEQRSLLIDTILPKDNLIVFQFKHKVVARVGEIQSRGKVLDLFKSSKNKISEVMKSNVVKLNPQTYVLVTNVEVNSNFRRRFIEQCKKENSNIKNYQIIGLDELESWVIADRNLRSQYFPLLFGKPRFNLKLKLQSGFTGQPLNPEQILNGGESAVKIIDAILCLYIMNTGECTSYLSSIKFKILINGKLEYLIPIPMPKGSDPLFNPPIGDPINPGKCLQFRYKFDFFRKNHKKESELFLSEVIVSDQIDNNYSLEISEEIRNKIFES